MFGPGWLKDHLQNPEVTEIVINNAKDVFVEKAGHLIRQDKSFNDELEYEQFARSLSQYLNQDISILTPFVAGRIHDHRLQIVGPPATSSVVLCFRRIQPKPWAIENFVIEPPLIQNLKDIVRSRQNILVFGATGSGKTSLLTAMMNEILETERVIVLEDTPELHLPNSCSVRMLTRHDPNQVMPEITLSDLIKHSLRLRPDRLALGEVRGAEALDLLMALATGHRGSFGTIHARQSHEALMRLETLVQVGAPQLSLPSIRSLVRSGIDYLVGVQRADNGARRITEICRITGVESFGYLLEPIYQAALTSSKDNSGTSFFI